MTIRSVLVATGSVLALVLAGCGTSIAGSPQAALPAGAAAGVESGTPDVGQSQDLSLPSDGAEPSSTDGLKLPDGVKLPDGTEMPDLSGILDGLGGLGNLEGLSGLEGLGDGKTLDPSDLGAILGALGSADGAGGLGALGGLTGLSPECASVTGAAFTLGMLLLAPMMGQPLTRADVDTAFANFSKFPPELSGAVSTLRKAAEDAIGKPAAEAGGLLSNPDVDKAMDQISNYMDEHCTGQ